MNCRRAREMLPELVAGELDEITAKRVMCHIDSCPTCAAEMAKYAEALGELARPRRMAEIPRALESLRLPEMVQRRGLGLRLELGAAVLAVALALAIPLLWVGRSHQTAVPKSHVAIQPTTQIPHVAEAPSGVREKRPAPRGVHIVRRPPGRIELIHNTRPEKSNVAVAVKEDSRPVVHPQPSIVVATYVEPPPEPVTIEIQTVDHANGEITTYYYYEVRDPINGRRTMEIKTIQKVENDRRT